MVFWFPFTRIRKINSQLSKKGEGKGEKGKKNSEREGINDKKATGVKNSKKTELQ